MLHRIAIVGALILLVIIVACRTMTPAGRLEIDRIAIVAHGIAFDSEMRPISIDLTTIASMQQSLRGMLLRARLPEDDNAPGFAAELEATVAQTQNEAERAVLVGTLIHSQLQRAGDRLRGEYEWRNRFLVERARALLEQGSAGPYVLPGILERLLREGGMITVAPPDFAYINECRAAGVPIPPDFHRTEDTGWIEQGNLTINLLSQGQPATVWTWTDPARRGACVALPRNNGQPGSQTGIICQSATTGSACIWDNLSISDPTRRIPTATEPLVLHNLLNGRTLLAQENCMSCHAGNNIFLMAPDDPTWSRLMRGDALLGPQPTPRTFTTVVEPLADTPGARRFTPIAQDGWVNPPLQSGCAGACHGMPSVRVLRRWCRFPDRDNRVGMAPKCSIHPDRESPNYRFCYGFDDGPVTPPDMTNMRNVDILCRSL